jgi:choline-sulfatase
MLTRRSLLGGLAASAFARAAKRKPLNFVFIIADDHAGYVLGCDGNRLAQTPNIDRLASEGTRFARHFCNSPVCTPSRQSFFTGQLPHMAGVTRLPTPLAEDKPTVARRLGEAGYQTAVFGKMHFNRASHPGLHGFDSLLTEADVQRVWSKRPFRQPEAGMATASQPWRPFKTPARVWLNADKLPFPRYYEDMQGAFIARQAVDYLKEHRGGQFALWVSFLQPHSPFEFPIDDRERFDPARFDVPRVGPEDAWQIPLIFRELSDADKRGIIAAYYSSVRFLDSCIGIVLDQIRALKLEQDTLVVYTADHGYSLGQHGRFEKHCGYEPALRVPLVFRLPGRIRKGVVNDMTEHIDVTPTILDVLGADPLAIQHGQSLRPYLEGGKMRAPRDHIFSEYLENEEAFIRTGRHKLIFCSGKRHRGEGYETDNPTPGRYVRLYDLRDDPGEFTDIAGKQPDVVKRLEGLMLERFRKTHPEAASEPKGLTPEEALEFYVRPRDV